MWDLHDTKPSHVLDELAKTANEMIFCMTFSPTGHQIAAGYWHGTVCFFDPQPKGFVSSKKLADRRVLEMAYSPSGQQLAIASNNAVYLWDLQSEKPDVTLGGHTDGLCCISYSPCSQWLASGSADEAVRLWHRQAGEEEIWPCVAVVCGFSNAIRSITRSRSFPWSLSRRVITDLFKCGEHRVAVVVIR